MRLNSLIICLVLILSLSGAASAQIVLPPADTGTPGTRITYVSYTGNIFGPYGPTSGSFTNLAVGKISTWTVTYYYPYPNPFYINFFYDGQGAIEFDLGATAFPTTMTSKNFTARLNGLNVSTSSQYNNSGPINVDLFDMGDGTEDGNVYRNDFNSTRCNRIERRTHMFSPMGTHADFNNIDVTCALRNDLFGAGAGNYSGFILKSPDAAYSEWIVYDPATPTLMINPGFTGTGPDCPDCGGSDDGGGCFIANATR